MDHKRARMMELGEGHGGHECACKQKNRLTCITLKNTDGINTAGSVSRLVGAVHAEGSYYEFDVGTSFSVHRHKPCTIRVCSGSVGYRNDVTEYLQAASALVNGAGQTGGTLTVDNLDIPQHIIKSGSTFTVAGVTGTYTLSAAFTSPSDTTLTFSPNLASSPADDALVTFAPAAVGVASIDLMTNIEVQGLCKNMPNSPAGQVVQCEMDVSATNQLNVTANNLTGIRIFHAAQPYMTQFRCQSLPDRIQLQMARMPAIFDQTTNNFSLSAPDFISITLEIEFDE